MIKLRPLIQGDTLSLRAVWTDLGPDGKADPDRPKDLAGFTAHLSIRLDDEPKLTLSSDTSASLIVGVVPGGVDVVTALGETDILTPGVYTFQLKVENGTVRHTTVNAQLPVRAYK